MISTEIYSLMKKDSNSIKDKILLDFLFVIKILAFVILSFIILGNSFFVKDEFFVVCLILLENINSLERILEAQRRG